LQISFPHTAAGEAIISAIAISTLNQKIIPAASSGGIITNLNTKKQSKWSVQSWMEIGQQVYTDANIRFSQLPSALYGADWIKTTVNNISYPASFSVNAAADVYIAIKVKAEDRPQWLKEYQPTGLSLQTDENGGTDFALYKKRYSANAVIQLNEYGKDGKYTVAVLPVTTLQPAVDLKRSVKYDVASASIQGSGIILDTLNKKKILRFTESAGAKATLIITPGVADSYNLSFRYYNNTTQVFKVDMQLQAADGTIMKSEVLNFKPLTKGKSSTVSVATGGSINAGNYKVILTAIDAKGLIISGFEMQ
ncbi:MAG: glycoside hydrolase family 2, partial [Sphingobacteriales bacterium]